MTITPQTPFRATGNTDRASFRAHLSRTVVPGVVPPPLAEADAIYDVLAPLGLTRLGAAMGWIERSNETDPEGLAFYGRELRNLWAVKNPPAEQATKGTWRRYPSYAAAAANWGPYLLGPVYADLTTIAQLIERYAPWSDGNNPADYGQRAAQLIDALPLLEEEEPPVSDWTPVIYDLSNSAHAARFGLSPAQASTIRAKKITNRNGRGDDAIEGIGLHVQDGYTTGSLEHWLGVSASSTVMVQQDGSLLRVIPDVDGPWTQGDVNSPDARARKLLDRYGWDPNVWSLTIEAEDARTGKINAAQERTIAWQIRQWQTKYPKLAQADWADRILGHYEINAVSRATCGRYRDAMVASLAGGGPALPNVPVYQGLPAWLTPAALEAAFELADPAGVVTKAVIAWAAETGRTPWFEGKTDLGNNRNIWKFEDVTLFNDGAKVWREGKAA
ncbi:MAG: hypothetical protein QM692_15095 [Thermomicrobiales bacterium]